MRTLLLILALTLFAGADTLKYGGVDRTYLVFAPSNTSGKVPLVMVLHDKDSTPVLTARLTRMHELGAKEGFMVVYPEGIDKLWIDGRQKYDRETRMTQQDDVGFLETVISTLVKTRNVDPSRIYVMGFGNGAMMALRMAVQDPGTFSAVGAVGGTLPELVDGALGKPVSLILINGSVDRLVPETGGPIQAGVELGRVLSAEATARRFVTAVGASDPPTRETPYPGVSVSHWSGRGEVVWARIADFAHEWPTSFDVSGMLWEFFKRQRRS